MSDPARHTARDAHDDGVDPLAGYRALRATGLDHDAVVRRLARDAIAALREASELRRLRGGRP